MPLEVTGLKEMATKIKKIEAVMKSAKISEKALRAGAEILRDEVKRRAPRSKGGSKHAADHVIISAVVEGKIAVGFIPDNWYMKYHEWGTSKMTPQPFLEPAFNAKRKEIQQAMYNVYVRELAKI
ncbi:HK97-gp10 family putative phage morphogenesis protein [Priestia sp. J2]|uniref:HK97-gp10 family putative phage morphogenesis protein n=1 Tax=Priestia sp. J2 TaxID=2886505 RepID=UPI001E2834EB|nr:HK97-gp10 family putative phage morphogenesis protein [Priestia sp. J2]